MSFFGLFKDKNNHSKVVSEQKIQKQVLRVREKYAKTDYRQMAMDTLLEWNTKESLRGVLERFCVVVDSPGADEAEKKWLVEEVAKKGKPAQEALIDFILLSNEVAHAIATLEKMCTKDEVLAALLAALAKRPPADHRLAESKVELIGVLHNYLSQPLVAEALIPYLQDHHDDVQLAAVEALCEEAKAYPKIAQMIHDNSRSARVLRQVAKTMAAHKIAADMSAALAEEVAEDFEVKDGFLSLKKY